jgi:hypothetical protein
MAIMTIPRVPYSKGKEVAEKVTQRLGYNGISRDVVVVEPLSISTSWK